MNQSDEKEHPVLQEELWFNWNIWYINTTLATGILTHISLFIHKYNTHNLKESNGQCKWTPLTISCFQLHEWARWTKSQAVIGHPSQQHGAILPTQDYKNIIVSRKRISMKAIPVIIINHLLTEFVKSRWLDIDYTIFCQFMDLNSALVNKPAKKRTWPISSHLELVLDQ